MRWPYSFLIDWYPGLPIKVAVAAMGRAYGRKLIECGTSLRSGWLTIAGEALLNDEG